MDRRRGASWRVPRRGRRRGRRRQSFGVRRFSGPVLDFRIWIQSLTGVRVVWICYSDADKPIPICLVLWPRTMCTPPPFPPPLGWIRSPLLPSLRRTMGCRCHALQGGCCLSGCPSGWHLCPKDRARRMGCCLITAWTTLLWLASGNYFIYFYIFY